MVLLVYLSQLPPPQQALLGFRALLEQPSTEPEAHSQTLLQVGAGASNSNTQIFKGDLPGPLLPAMIGQESLGCASVR